MWFLHIKSETMGPVSTSTVEGMLKKEQVTYFEFAWTEGLDQWTRLCDIDDFNQNLPQYPSEATPGGEVSEPVAKKSAPVTAPTPAPAKKKETAKPAPVEEPPAPIQQPKTKFSQTQKFVRIEVDGKVVLDDGTKYSIVNLSEGGVFVEAKKMPEVGSELKFKLSVKGLEKDLEMTGVVIRVSQDGDGFAIEFIRLNPAHRRALTALIQKG